jgi:hypothetical protein
MMRFLVAIIAGSMAALYGMGAWQAFGADSLYITIPVCFAWGWLVEEIIYELGI